MRKVVSGSQAAAEAVKLIKPGVIAAYPITPQTGIVEQLAKWVADGELSSEFIRVESEHSAMAACIGAQATGVRSYTATSSQGLALMSELLWIASGMRLPIVMTVVNRSLSAPLSIWNDQADSLAFRDSGWIQLYCESGQEIFDTHLQAYRIAESVRLPVMVCMDGYILSHTYEPVELLEDLKGFLPEYKPDICLNPARPLTLGCLATPEYYQQFKLQQERAMEEAKHIIKEVNRAFYSEFGRIYGNGMLETAGLEEAEYGLITLGSVSGTVKAFLDELKIGLIRLKAFRPFPKEDLRKKVEGLKAVGVLEKACSFGSGGPVWHEVRSCLAGSDIAVSGWISGLGGKDIGLEELKLIAEGIKQEKDGIEWV